MVRSEESVISSPHFIGDHVRVLNIHKLIYVLFLCRRYGCILCVDVSVYSS